MKNRTDGSPHVTVDASVPSGAGTNGEEASVSALPCQQVSFLASSKGESGSTSHTPLDLPAEIPYREESKSLSDTECWDTNSSFSYILHLNAYRHKAVTDTSPHHPPPMSRILPLVLGTSHLQPTLTWNRRCKAMGNGQTSKMLSGQKQPILSGGFNLW